MELTFSTTVNQYTKIINKVFASTILPPAYYHASSPVLSGSEESVLQWEESFRIIKNRNKFHDKVAMMANWCRGGEWIEYKRMQMVALID